MLVELAVLPVERDVEFRLVPQLEQVAQPPVVAWSNVDLPIAPAGLHPRRSNDLWKRQRKVRPWAVNDCVDVQPLGISTLKDAEHLDATSMTLVCISEAASAQKVGKVADILARMNGVDPPHPVWQSLL